MHMLHDISTVVCTDIIAADMKQDWLADLHVEGRVMHLPARPFQKERERETVITSFPANLGLIRCLVPHGRAGRCVRSF